MPRIINGYTTANPLAKVIADLGNVMFSDTATPALKRQKIEESQRKEYGIDQMARQMGAGGVLDPNKAAEMAVLGEMDPDNLAMFQTFLAGNLHGPRDPLTTNAMAGMGKYKDSAQSFDIDQSNAMTRNVQDNDTSRANNAATNANASQMNLDDIAAVYRMFIEKPEGALDAAGNPTFVQQGNLAKPGTPYAPIPTNDSQIDPVKKLEGFINAAKAAGITDPAAQRDYALKQISKSAPKGITLTQPDGSVIQIGGEGDGGVGALTNANTTKVQADVMAGQQFDSLLDQTAATVAANPNSVGAVGNVRGAAQSVRIAAQGFAQMIGAPSVDDAWQQVQAEALAMGVKPETLNFAYDPSLSEIETLYKMLAFQGIRTIGGQSGNDASDRDFKNIQAILGDPNSWMTNAQDLTSKMKVVKKYVKMRTAQNRAALGLAPLPDNTAPQATDSQSGRTTSSGVTWEPM